MPPRALLDDHLVDQDDLMQRFLSSEPANGNMSTVLEFVANHGVKLVTGQLLYVRFDIQRHPFVGRGSESVIDELGRWLGNGTILGTLAIHDDYPMRVDKVYLGLGRRLRVERQGRPDYEVNHSVVILGVFNVDSTLAAGWSCPVGNYFVYQDSKGPQYRGLMGFGRTLGHPRVLLKVYQAPVLRFPPIYM